MKISKPYSLLLIVIFGVLSSCAVFAQSLEELQKKFNESGMTKEEALRNIVNSRSSEDSIKALQAAQNKEAANVSSVTPQSTVITPPEASHRPASWKVLDFTNREGAANLDAFGYSIFNYSPSTFEPSVNIPVPTNYIIGPGDEIVISLWGETQLVNNLTVSKDGDIYVPNVGLISVNGLTLTELRSKLFDSLSKVYASLKPGGANARTKLDVSTGKLRSVKVYVLGEVNTPGGYTLPALSTAFTALYYSGGPSINGTLRDVQVLRKGVVIKEMDLYDYIIKGSKENDVKLEDGDVIFVKPVGNRVAIAGNAFRPAIYELKPTENLSDLLNYAGGLKYSAYFDRIHIERLIPFADRKNYQNNILSIDLKFESVDKLLSSNYKIENGDVVSIAAVNQLPENRVTISGPVHYPGVYEIPDSGLTIKDLIEKASGLLPEAFTEKGILIRTLPSEKKEIFNFNITKAMHDDPGNNLKIENKDEIRLYVQQSFLPNKNVEITGEVKKPGFYTRFKGMTLTDLIIVAGGLTDSAYTSGIEISRADTTDPEKYFQSNFFDLPKNYWQIKKSEDFILKDYDRVLIKPNPNRVINRSITIKGEVNFPGTYPILYEGERFNDFLRRAGGFKSTAFKKGIYVQRGEKLLNKAIGLHLPDSLLFKVDNDAVFDRTVLTDYSNRIPIDMEEVEDDSNSISNLRLQPNDVVVVPKDPSVITVIGDVGLPSYVTYKRGEGLNYYIKQAGNYTGSSAKGHEVVILPNGKKWSPSGWFFIPDSPILSGSVVIVPTKIERSSTVWPLIRDIFTIASSAAVLILTVHNLTK